MFSYLQTLHFLRPHYFALIIPLVILISYLLYKRRSKLLMPTEAIAPHLMAELVDRPNQREGYGPIIAVSLVVLLVIGALVKPVWRVSDTSPEDNPPLYVVMDESSSMSKTDVIPSRNMKAQLIVKHLINSGINRPIAIVAMSGSSHILLPPTDDQNLLSLYLSYLDPKVMPEDGGDLASLVERLNNTKGLKHKQTSLLLVTDGVSSGISTLKSYIKENQVVAATLYLNDLGKQVSNGLNIPAFDGAKMGVSDNALQQYFLNTQAGSSESKQWQDESHWLIIIAAIFVALWFRKGWTLQWTLCLLLLMPYSQSSEAGVIDWFVTQDQQGMVLMYMGKYQEAEQYFEDPNWKAMACYYQEDFKCAQKEFAKNGDLTAVFNMGNAAAQDGRYKTAQQLYLALLEIEPNNVQAKQNLDVVNAILLEMKMLNEKQHDQHPPAKDAVPPPKDVNEISDGAKRKSFGQIPHSKLKAADVLSNDDTTNKWLRDISLDPKDFIRRKFLSEYNQEMNQ